MLEPAAPVRPLAAVGEYAQRALGAGEGRVLAVFRRSFYLRTRHGLVCVGPVEMGNGPLHALCRLPAHWDWQARGLHIDTPLRWSADCRSPIDIAGLCSLSRAAATLWRPPAPVSAPASRLTANLAVLADGLARHSPRGLGRVIAALIARRAIADATLEQLLRPASSGIGAFSTWLAHPDHDRSDPPPALARLVGLGPGLTPAGDDFIAGALIALGYRRPGVARRLAEWVLPLAQSHSNLISHAHLAAASDAQGAQAVHQMIDLLTGSGSGFDSALRRIDGIGHSSGWDALAGVVAVFSACQ